MTFLLLAIPAFAAGSADQEVLAVDAWKQAALKGDAATLDKLYHPDLAYTHSNGMTQNKTVAWRPKQVPQT